jgi:D-glycero-alpha-D-manno-heptose-7-phosphate kinase
MLITTKTPLRVSFLGGGSDYPNFFEKEAGFVIGTTVNLFVYVSILPNNELSTEGYRLNYSLHEDVSDPKDFKHPVVREVLAKYRSQLGDLTISTMADAPAQSGLGSSSSFTVSLLQSIKTLLGHTCSPEDLAKEAIDIEREVLGEAGGYQDQYHAAFGGLALYRFTEECIERRGITNPHRRILDDCMFLVPVGLTRKSHDHASSTNSYALSPNGHQLISQLSSLTEATFFELESACSEIDFLGKIAQAMVQAWEIKKQYSNGISNPQVDQIVNLGLEGGALAGKLCGAGGSGFVLFLVPPENQERFREKFNTHRIKKVSITTTGSSVLLNEFSKSNHQSHQESRP